MLRAVLELILVLFVARAFWRVIDGVIQGLAGPTEPPTRHSSHMVRDPVCGTFILPDRSVTLPGERSQNVYFCSTACRDAYRTGRTPLKEAPGTAARR